MASKDKKQAQPALTDAELNQKWEHTNEYQVYKRLNDRRLGEGTVLKHLKTGELIFLKEKLSSNRNEASNDLRELRARVNLNSPYLQRLLGYSSAIKKELCSTSYITQGYYEFPPQDVNQSLEAHKRDLTAPAAADLHQLLSDTVAAADNLHSKNITHGDIRPEYVMIAKKESVQPGQPRYRLIDRLADPSPLEKAQANNIVNRKDLYISPELWKKLQGKDKTLKFSANKNDVYAVGLTTLYYGLQDSVQDLYQPNGDFNQTRLNEHLNNFGSKYQNQNPALVAALRTILSPNESDRPEAQQLLSALKSGNQGAFGNTQSATFNQNQYQGYAQTNVKAAQDYTPYVQQNYAVQSTQDKYIVDRSETNDNSSYNNYTNNTTQVYSHGQNETANYSYAPSHTTTYVRAEPTTHTTYTQEYPTTYTSGDATTYAYTQPTTTFVNANVDGSRVERKSYTYTNPTYTTTYTTAPATHSVIHADGTRVERKSYTYTAAPVTTTTYTAAPVTTYTTAPVTTYTTAPLTTYSTINADGTRVERKSYTYTAAPVTTVSSINPDGTRIERKSYTYTNAPITTTTYTTAPTTYVSSAPTTYVNAPMTTYSTIGVDGTRVERKSYTTYTAAPVTTYTTAPTTYVSSAPTTYVNAPMTTYSTINADGTRVERKSYTYTAAPITTVSSINPDGTRVERKSYTYSTNPVTTTYTTAPTTYVSANAGNYTTINADGVRVERKSYTYNANPTSISYAQPSTYTTINPDGTRVERKSYTYSANPTTVTYAQPSTYTTTYSQYPAETRVESQLIQGARTYTTPSNYGETRTYSNVEVRKSTHTPYEGDTRVVKKKYIIEGDRVLEVDADDNDQGQQGQQYDQQGQHYDQQGQQYDQYDQQEYNQHYDQQGQYQE